MAHESPRKIIGTLVRRDLGCAGRNPTVLACTLVPLGLCWFLGAFAADDLAAMPGLRNFASVLAALFPTLEAGGVLTLFVMGEEGSRGTYRLMERWGVTPGHIIAAKVIVGMLASAVVTTACFWLMGVDLARLVPIALAAAVGSVPTLLLFCACGLRSDDQIRASFWAAPITLIAMTPLLGALGPAVGSTLEPVATLIAAASPTTFLAGACTALATGDANALGLSLPVMVASAVAWLAIGSLILGHRMGTNPAK